MRLEQAGTMTLRYVLHLLGCLSWLSSSKGYGQIDALYRCMLKDDTDSTLFNDKR